MPATDTGLTPFQLQLAQLFFALPESAGFLLAGGAALAAQHLTNRPTQDLDFFTGPERGDVPAASAALEAEVEARAEARDFADVYQLAQRYGKGTLLARAAQVDAGFNHGIFADMLGTLERFADDDVPIDPGQLRSMRMFFAAWEAELKPDATPSGED